MQIFTCEENSSPDDYLYNALVAVFQLHRSAPPGLEVFEVEDVTYFSEDMLVFLTGREEIEIACAKVSPLWFSFH